MATVYIASPIPVEPGLPYNDRIEGGIHRLFNPNTGQHLYSADPDEADALSRIGWGYEGIAWVDSGERSGAPAVYRLYNPYNGDHLYTSDEDEYHSLSDAGWQDEGVAFHSDPDLAQPVYRLYNPYAEIGAHHFTTDATEYDELVLQGWIGEDVCWYGAGSNADGSWSLPAGNRPHDDAGDYHVEAIAIPAEGVGDGPTEHTIGETTFSVTAPTATTSITAVDEDAGTFEVVVDDVESVSGIIRVEVPVWTAPDRSDLVRYPTTPQPDGTYRVTVQAIDHDLAHDYTAMAHLVTGNGLRIDAAQASCHLDLADFVRLSGGPNRYTLTIVNPGPATSVQMPTWSVTNGQDDLVWYEATKDGDRWSATIDTANLLDSGHCIAHIYVDGQFRREVSFEVSPKEVLTSRQHAILGAVHEVPSQGAGYCSEWVSTVLMRAGLPFNMADDADDMYYRLHGTDLGEILPGMAIAVSTHSHSSMGSIWGHVGIYIGDGIVMDDVGYVRQSSLLWWVDYYSDRVPVHFGFLEY